MPDSTQQYRCFRCHNGCIHIVCGNTTINLNESQFLALFDAITEMQLQIQSEEAAMQADSSQVVM